MTKRLHRTRYITQDKANSNIIKGRFISLLLKICLRLSLIMQVKCIWMLFCASNLVNTLWITVSSHAIWITVSSVWLTISSDWYPWKGVFKTVNFFIVSTLIYILRMVGIKLGTSGRNPDIKNKYCHNDIWTCIYITSQPPTPCRITEVKMIILHKQSLIMCNPNVWNNTDHRTVLKWDLYKMHWRIWSTTYHLLQNKFLIN